MWNPLENLGKNTGNKTGTMTFWHYFLVTLIILWCLGGYLCWESKHQTSNPPKQTTSAQSDIFPFVNFGNSLSTTNSPPASFISKLSYTSGDVVFVKYFGVKAMVEEKCLSLGDYYTILYRDKEGVFQHISLPRQFLLVPSDGDWMPFSLSEH